ncbi:hypothetical protein Pelo_258 [Pelomyxa schiedti]|nr:hypothetical protein Pelo_14199 [Pelomyxa schiedti]KAH3767865.1 hypothetical protein Pelo_258 [Pelomyxa schiedti]
MYSSSGYTTYLGTALAREPRSFPGSRCLRHIIALARECSSAHDVHAHSGRAAIIIWDDELILEASIMPALARECSRAHDLLPVSTHALTMCTPILGGLRYQSDKWIIMIIWMNYKVGTWQKLLGTVWIPHVL